MTQAQQARIAPALAPLVVPIERVRLHPDNYNEGDVGSIAESMQEFTQYKPIVAQASSGRVLAGNHTYLAAVGLKWREIAVVFLDCDDLTATRILAGDNRHSRRARVNEASLGALLRELAEADALAGTGYDGDDVDALLRDLERDQAAQPGGYPAAQYGGAPTFDGAAAPGMAGHSDGGGVASSPRSAAPPEQFREFNEATLTTEHQCPRCSYRW